MPPRAAGRSLRRGSLSQRTAPRARALPALALLVASLVALAFAAPAAASPLAPPATCAASVIAWTARLSAAIEIPAEATACRPGAVVIRLRPRGAVPIDVEITGPHHPAFRRAGRLGTAPIVEIADYLDLPAPQRGAFEALTAWVAAHEAEVGIGDTPPEDASIPGSARAPTLLALAALLGIAARVVAPRAPAASRFDRRAPLALFAAALALRLAFGLWGPLHVNGQGPLWIRAALAEPALLDSYGPGYRELFSLPARLFAAAPDRAIFALNAALSALASPLAFALARACGIERRPALVSAVVIALDAVAVRGAATESYFPSLIALTLGAQLLLVLAASDPARARLRSALLALAGALLAAQAARIHPVGWGPLALAPLAVLAAGPRSRARSARLALGASAALLVALTIAATSGAGIVARFAESTRHGRSAGGLLGAVVPALVAAATLLALALVRRRWIVIAAGAHLALLLLTRHIFAKSALCQASYDSLYLALPVIGLVALVPALIARAGAAPAAAIVALALAFFAVRETAAFTPRTTEQLEYPWLRDRIAALPGDCVMVNVLRAGERRLFLPDYRAHGPRPVAVESAEDMVMARAKSRCVVYARASLCSSREGRARCEAIEAADQTAFEEMAKASFPAAPSMDSLPYDRAMIEDALLGVGVDLPGQPHSVSGSIPATVTE